MSKYFYIEGSQKKGAFSLEELKEKGVISPETRMWTEGMKRWLPAGSIEEVSSFFGFEYQPVIPKVKMSDSDKRARHQEIDKKNRVYSILMWIIHGLSLLSMFLIYGLLFDEFSESELVFISFFWIIPFVFSLAGIVAVWIRSRYPWLVSLVALIACFQVLYIFFEFAWSSL